MRWLLVLVWLTSSEVPVPPPQPGCEPAECPANQVWDSTRCMCANAEPCGKSTCGQDEYCCNQSCGICAPLGGACTQLACDPPEPLPISLPGL